MAKGLQRIGSQAHTHQALHPLNERQGRAIHQNPSGRMGVCHAVPDLRGTEPMASPLSEAL
jgi:hypothetical protein